MEYQGSGVRLRQGELAEIAHEHGLEEAHLRTVIEVETSGKGFNQAGWVEFLFEPHVFYRTVPKAKQAEAIRRGLAYPTWRGPGSYPKSLQLRIQQFQQAAALDETSAIKSASWGLGQVMGSECDEVGFATPQAMLEAFKESEANQVRGMCNLIKRRGIDKDLRNFPDMAACRHFALRYNGKAYEKNKYHIKLHDSYVRWSGKSRRVEPDQTLDPLQDGWLRYGEYDPEQTGGPIWQAQSQLKKLGYSLLVDGKYGRGTRATVLAWKVNNHIDTSNGDLSPSDLEMLKISPPMPIPEERATATVEDLKPKSTIVQTTSLGQKIMAWLGLGTAGTAAAQNTGLLDTAQNTLDKAEQAKSVTSQVTNVLGFGLIDVLKFAYEWRFLILLAACGIGFYYFHYIQKKRVEMHRNAELA